MTSCTQGRDHECKARKDTQGVPMYTGDTDTFAHRPPGEGAHTKYIQAVLITLNTSIGSHQSPRYLSNITLACVAWTSLPFCVCLGRRC